MGSRSLLVASLVLVLSAPVYGQRFGNGTGPGWGPGRGNPGPQGPPPTSQEGTIEKVVQGGLVMSTKGGMVNVAVGPATKVHLTGSAETSFIKKGVQIEFTGEVDKKHAVAEKISSLTVVTLTPQRLAGLFPEGSDSAAGDDDNFGFAAGADKGTDSAPAEKGTKKTKKEKPAPIKLPGTYVVRGTVNSCKAGKIMVKIDKGVVRAELADDAQIAVDITDQAALVNAQKATPSRSGVVPLGRACKRSR